LSVDASYRSRFGPADCCLTYVKIESIFLRVA
jgi:hypothetical protein